MLDFRTGQWRALIDQRQVLIWGLSREGWSSYLFLRKYFPDLKITLADQKPLAELEGGILSIIQADTLSNFKLEAELDFGEYDLVFISSGISPFTARYQEAHLKKSAITTNTALFMTIIEELRSQAEAQRSPGPEFPLYPLLIGVTGTKGKTTTASLIYEVLRKAGRDVWLGGNIGRPALTVLEEAGESPQDKELVFVLELSSHQLYHLQHSPQIAVIQAITPEHLDYYPDEQTYYQAKSAITIFQKAEDWVIYDLDSQPVLELAGQSQAQKLSFSLNQVSADWHLQADQLYLGREAILNTIGIPLLGQHNLLNVMPALAVGKLLSLDQAQVNQAVTEFTPVEHRLELVAQVNGVDYVNDSAATTPEAAAAALAVFAGRPIILLAGGSDKGVSFQVLAERMAESNLKLLLLFPVVGAKILAAAEAVFSRAGMALPKWQAVETMPGAFAALQGITAPGDVVLLSPAAASFSNFKNYQDRGEQFRAEAVRLKPR